MNEIYEAPTIRIVKTVVEKGFATSKPRNPKDPTGTGDDFIWG